jgi:hypothetical protein
MIFRKKVPIYIPSRSGNLKFTLNFPDHLRIQALSVIVKSLARQFIRPPFEVLPNCCSRNPSPKVAFRAWSCGSIDGCPEQIFAYRAPLGPLRASLVNYSCEAKALGNAI